MQIVTGAASGIGRAVAERLARDGATVFLIDVDEVGTEETARRISAGGGSAQACAADVASSSDCERAVHAAAALGRLDALVNVAGVMSASDSVELLGDEELERILAVNVKAIFRLGRHVVPALRRSGGGTIVNTASVVAAVGIRNRAAYCASKGAVAALTRAIAIDHVADGIRCNAVAPGTIDTPYFDEILRKSPDPEAARKGLEARQLLGRLGTPEEIAAGILFLASDESRFATGTILTIDGGMTAQ